MSTRKTANDVHSDLRVHEKMCEERWKTIYKKTDALQDSVDSTKYWLIGGLTTIVASLITLLVKTSI
jgi:adenosyl cobinamide kinase/adenosyl cobinamide phosphate guanylyltransferase|tara:strand:+ start:819 stop:1019 length:201 start_codon:yes stop_codon:yes gene_type:complete